MQRCTRCMNGQAFHEDPGNPKSDVVCLQCGEWQRPKNWHPQPYISRLEDTTYKKTWEVDKEGNIVDEIDLRVEDLLATDDTFTVSQVARSLHCSNGDARMSLERLLRMNRAETIRYGPQSRWTGYKRKVV